MARWVRGFLLKIGDSGGFQFSVFGSQSEIHGAPGFGFHTQNTSLTGAMPTSSLGMS